jgi:integrase/recombinase XerD
MSEKNMFKRGGIWWLRTTAAGVEYRESLRARETKAARAARDKRLAEINAAAHHGQVKRSWREAVIAWVEHEAGNIAQTTARRYDVSFGQCESYLADLDIAAIDGKAIAALIQGRRAAGASNATIRRDLTAVSRVLTFAEGMDWREGNPTLSKRRTVKERRDPIALPDHADIERVIAAASPRFGAFVRAAWLTGCRQDELVRTTWRQFNARAETLEVIGKGNKLRTIKLSAQATAHLAAQPRTLGSDLIFCLPGGVGYVAAASDFCHVRRTVEAKLASVSPRANFRRFRFHDLRHLFAVEALRDGMDIYTLSKHLGHTSVKTTEDHYLAFLTPAEADAAKKGRAA